MAWSIIVLTLVRALGRRRLRAKAATRAAAAAGRAGSRGRPAAPEPRRPTTTRLDRFCGSLQRIVDAEASGFQGLRAERVGPSAWRGAVVPEGLSTCTVEGSSHPGAQYVCTGSRAQRGNSAVVTDAFRRISADLDACLGRAVWFPRNWQRGELIEFAGVEQQQVWRDLTATPRPVVALNIDEDILNRIYSIRFAVSTFR